MNSRELSCGVIDSIRNGIESCTPMRSSALKLEFGKLVFCAVRLLGCTQLGIVVSRRDRRNGGRRKTRCSGASLTSTTPRSGLRWSLRTRAKGAIIYIGGRHVGNIDCGKRVQDRGAGVKGFDVVRCVIDRSRGTVTACQKPVIEELNEDACQKLNIRSVYVKMKLARSC